MTEEEPATVQVIPPRFAENMRVAFGAISEAVAKALAAFPHQMQGANDYVDTEWRKSYDRRAHPRAYRGIKQYKKARAV